MSFKTNNMEDDIRWEQRFANYRKALKKLNIAITVIAANQGGKEEEEVLKEGLIQRFEYTHELAWKVMKDYAEYQGNTAITGSRDATREAFKMGLLQEADSWKDMLASRNLTSHTYNADTAEEIYDKISGTYSRLFNDFENKMEMLQSGFQQGMFGKMMKFGLKDNEIMEIQKICNQYPEVEKDVIFGSQAKGNFKPASNIDIALKGAALNSSVLNKISNALQDSALPYTFDLVLFQHITNKELIDHIERVGKVLFEKGGIGYGV